MNENIPCWYDMWNRALKKNDMVALESVWNAHAHAYDGWWEVGIHPYFADNKINFTSCQDSSGRSFFMTEHHPNHYKYLLSLGVPQGVSSIPDKSTPYPRPLWSLLIDRVFPVIGEGHPQRQDWIDLLPMVDFTKPVNFLSSGHYENPLMCMMALMSTDTSLKKELLRTILTQDITLLDKVTSEKGYALSKSVREHLKQSTACRDLPIDEVHQEVWSSLEKKRLASHISATQNLVSKIPMRKI